jgi:uncharacterized iron-regulated membrane protein
MSTDSLPRTAPAAGRSAVFALWRLHALAALLATPVLVLATITGLIYLPTPQIERWQNGHLDQVPGTAAAPWRTLDPLVASAQAAAPEGWVLRHVAPPSKPGESLRVQFAPPGGQRPAGEHAGHVGHGAAPTTPVNVFIDPGTGAVLGTQADDARFNHWAKRLHAQLLQGDGWRWLIEWAATCLLVMLVTGLALALPTLARTLQAQGLQGRAAWRRWHLLGGVALAGLSLVIVLTGLTWSQTAGGQVRALRDWAGQAPPKVPKDLRSATAVEGAQPLSWQAVWTLAQAQAPAISLQLAPPRGANAADGVWRISTIDRTQPTRRQELALDARSGAVLWRSGWADLPAFAQATAIGIPFHRGEFGLWNQALLLLFALGLLGSVLSGWVMAWRRWRAGGLLLPRMGAWRDVFWRWRWRWPAFAATAALCALVPLLAPLLLIYLALGLRAPRAATPTA